MHIWCLNPDLNHWSMVLFVKATDVGTSPVQLIWVQNATGRCSTGGTGTAQTRSDSSGGIQKVTKQGIGTHSSSLSSRKIERQDITYITVTRSLCSSVGTCIPSRLSSTVPRSILTRRNLKKQVQMHTIDSMIYTDDSYLLNFTVEVDSTRIPLSDVYFILFYFIHFNALIRHYSVYCCQNSHNQQPRLERCSSPDSHCQRS